MQQENHRTPEERDVARANSTIVGMLATRGISVDAATSGDDLAYLLDAVELFEEAVARAGGDSMTKALDSSEPDDPRFVLPTRRDGERVRDYALRLRSAASRLGRAD